MSALIQFQATPPGKQQQSVFARPTPAKSAAAGAAQQRPGAAARGAEVEAAADVELKREIKGAQSWRFGSECGTVVNLDPYKMEHFGPGIYM